MKSSLSPLTHLRVTQIIAVRSITRLLMMVSRRTGGGYTVFCNPPYGKQLAKWVRKAYEESRKPNTTIVLLIPARTDTQWFHDYIYGTAEIRFIKGRIKFKGAMYNAPFPSMIVIYRSADCAGKEK